MPFNKIITGCLSRGLVWNGFYKISEVGNKPLHILLIFVNFEIKTCNIKFTYYDNEYITCIEISLNK